MLILKTKDGNNYQVLRAKQVYGVGKGSNKFYQYLNNIESNFKCSQKCLKLTICLRFCLSRGRMPRTPHAYSIPCIPIAIGAPQDPLKIVKSAVNLKFEKHSFRAIMHVDFVMCLFSLYHYSLPCVALSNV